MYRSRWESKLNRKTVFFVDLGTQNELKVEFEKYRAPKAILFESIYDESNRIKPHHFRLTDLEKGLQYIVNAEEFAMISALKIDQDNNATFEYKSSAKEQRLTTMNFSVATPSSVETKEPKEKIEKSTDKIQRKSFIVDKDKDKDKDKEAIKNFSNHFNRIYPKEEQRASGFIVATNEIFWGQEVKFYLDKNQLDLALLFSCISFDIYAELNKRILAAIPKKVDSNNNNHSDSSKRKFSPLEILNIRGEFDWRGVVTFLMDFGLLENIDFDHVSNYGVATAITIAMAEALTSDKTKEFESNQNQAVNNFNEHYVKPLLAALKPQFSFLKKSSWSSKGAKDLFEIVAKHDEGANRTHEFLKMLGYYVPEGVYTSTFKQKAYYSTKMTRLCDVLLLLTEDVRFDKNMNIILDDKVLQAIYGYNSETITKAETRFLEHYIKPLQETIVSLPPSTKKSVWEWVKKGELPSFHKIAEQYLAKTRTHNNLNDMGFSMDEFLEKNDEQCSERKFVTKKAVLNFLVKSENLQQKLVFDDDLRWSGRDTIYYLKLDKGYPIIDNASGDLKIIVKNYASIKSLIIDMKDENTVLISNIKLGTQYTIASNKLQNIKYVQLEKDKWDFETDEELDLETKSFTISKKSFDNLHNVIQEYVLIPYQKNLQNTHKNSRPHEIGFYKNSYVLNNQDILQIEDYFHWMLDYVFEDKMTSTGQFLSEVATAKYFFDEQGQSLIHTSQQTFNKHKKEYGEKIAWVLMLIENSSQLKKGNQFKLTETCIDFDSKGVFKGFYDEAEWSILRTNTQETCFFRNYAGAVSIEGTGEPFEIYLTFLDLGQHYKLNLKPLLDKPVKLWASDCGNLGYELPQNMANEKIIKNHQELEVNEKKQTLKNFNHYFIEYKNIDLKNSFMKESRIQYDVSTLGEIFSLIDAELFESLPRLQFNPNQKSNNNNNNNPQQTKVGMAREIVISMKCQNWSRTTQFLLDFGLLENFDHNHFNNYGMKTAVFLALMKSLSDDKIKEFRLKKENAVGNFDQYYCRNLEVELAPAKNSGFFQKTSYWQSKPPSLDNMINHVQSSKTNRTHRLLEALGYNASHSPYYSTKIVRLTEALQRLDQKVTFDDKGEFLLDNTVADKLILDYYTNDDIKTALDNFNKNYRARLLDFIKKEEQTYWRKEEAKTIAEIANKYIAGVSNRTKSNFNKMGFDKSEFKIDSSIEKYYGKVVATEIALMKFMLNSEYLRKNNRTDLYFTDGGECLDKIGYEQYREMFHKQPNFGW